MVEVAVRQQDVGLLERDLEAAASLVEEGREPPAIDLHPVDVAGLQAPRAPVVIGQDQPLGTDGRRHVGDQASQRLVLGRDDRHVPQLLGRLSRTGQVA